VSDPNRWKTHNVGGEKSPLLITKETLVSDTSSTDILEQILSQLKAINIHLSILSGEEIQDGEIT
jgi:hypothetical protein